MVIRRRVSPSALKNTTRIPIRNLQNGYAYLSENFTPGRAVLCETCACSGPHEKQALGLLTSRSDLHLLYVGWKTSSGIATAH